MAKARAKKTAAAGKEAKAAPKRRSKKTVEAGSRGLSATELPASTASTATQTLARAIVDDGGSVLATYRDPLGGHEQLLAGIPLDKVEPTPFQRDLSAAHAERLREVLDKLDRFLDPIVLVRTDDGRYWTPNGHHRTAAMKALGARSIVALVVPEFAVAYKILALNTEKAHNLREKCLEVVRMARSLAEIDPRTPESTHALEFEEPTLITLGCCYEENGRFAGGVYAPVVKRLEHFVDEALSAALDMRRARAARLVALDEAVAKVVAALKEKGFDSPYLKNFVVARIDPLRFKRGATGEFDEVIGTMIDKARAFEVGSVRAEQVARSVGPVEGG